MDPMIETKEWLHGQKLIWNDAVEDIIAARKFLEKAGKVGIVGYCYGGTIAWLGACKGGFKAASGYYGGGIHENLDLEAQRVLSNSILVQKIRVFQWKM